MGGTPTNVPQSPIPPGPDGGCPIGFILNPVDNMCYFVAPPIQVSATGVTLPDVDPRNAAALTGLGTGDSGLPERFAIAFWQALSRMASPQTKTPHSLAEGVAQLITDTITFVINQLLNAYDLVITLIAKWLGQTAGRNMPEYWDAIGALISDLLGIKLDGQELFNQLQTRGTLAAMQETGAGLVNLLIGEFTGTASGTGGDVAFSSDVNPETGLPVATLTPAGGIQGMQRLMGFVLSSSVRQANIEGLTEWIPIGLGSAFEKYSQAMRTNLGIGRMLRFAWRPIFQILIADPMKWALNMQYRPTMFNAAEASRAVNSKVYTQADFLAEAARGGYTDKRAFQLLDQHSRKADVNNLLILRAAGVLGDSDFDNFLGRDGFDVTHAAYTRQAADLEPARRVALALAEHTLLEFGKGSITTQALKDFIDGIKAAGFLLAPGEVTALEAVANKITVNVKLRPKHLTEGKLHKAYIDGTITLQEYEDYLTQLGYSANDVQILGIEVLLDAKKAQAAAAKKTAAALKGNTTAANTPAGTNPLP